MGHAITTSATPPDQPIGRRSLLFNAIAACFIFIVAALVFAPTLSYGLLQWDDPFHLTENPFLQVDSPSRYVHFWQQPFGNLYVPITYNVWAWLYAQCHDDAGTFSPGRLHAANILIHAINSVLTFFVLHHLLRHLPTGTERPSYSRSLAAGIGALVFCLHPLQVESVAWISEMRGLLAACFGLAATLAYLCGSDPIASIRSRFLCAYLLAPLLFALALLCKPSATALPIVWLAVDAIGLQRPWRSIASRLTIPVMLVIASTLLMRSLQTGNGLDAGKLWERPLIASDAITFYLGKLLWPFALCADYSRMPSIVRSSSTFAITWLVPCLIVMWLARGAFRNGKQTIVWRVATLAFAMFVAALAPVLGLVPFDFQYLSTVADRYAYVSLLGPAILIAFFSARDQRVAIGMIAVLAMLAWRTVDQQPNWRDDQSLWQHAATVNPQAAVAKSNLAQQAARRGDLAEADRLYREVIKIAPGRGNGYRGLAHLALNASRPAEALDWYEQAAKVDPNDVGARDGAAQLHEAFGRPDLAEARYRDALKINLRSASVLNNFAAFLTQQNRSEEAIEALKIAVESNPRFQAAWMNLAIAYNAHQDTTQADAAIQHAERLAKKPLPAIRVMLGESSMRRQDWGTAAQWFESAIAYDPSHLAALNGLATTYVGMGQVDEAITTFERAIATHPQSMELRQNLETARRLKSASTTMPAK